MSGESAIQFPGNSRIHIALAVSNLERSKAFYEILFGQSPTKERPGYVKFEPHDPSVNLTLNEVHDPESLAKPATHYGIQVKSTKAVEDAISRLSAAGLLTDVEEDTTCCYAVQDKVWITDPDGNLWEVFVVLQADADQRKSDRSACCTPNASGRRPRVAVEADKCMTESSISTEQLWGLFSERLKSFLMQRVSDEQVADDLLQETFVRIHQRLDSLEDSQRINSWVFRIARNLVIDYYRSAARQAASAADELEDRAEDNDNLNEIVAGWLPTMITQLPENYRQAVELYEIEGVPQQQIADELGITLSGAKSRVQRGREKLKSILLDCCTLERDRRGNVIGYVRNEPDRGPCGTDECDSP